MHASDKEGTKMTYEQGSSVRVDIKQLNYWSDEFSSNIAPLEIGTKNHAV